MLRFSLLFCGLALLPASALAKVTVYPLPAEIRSDRFTVTIDGKPAPVAHAARGYYFVNFDLEGSARIAVTAESADYWAKGVEVQPWRHGIRPILKGKTIAFTLSKPAKLSISRPGDHYGNAEMLFLFANPPEVNPPKQGDPGVRYYGPGLHREDIHAQSGETIYLDGGAVVLGSLNLWGVENVKVLGRGTLIHDGPQNPNDDQGWMHRPNWHAIVMDNARNVEVRGITCVVRSRTWMIQAQDSRQVAFENIKVIGGCPGNANQDGIDWLGGGDAVVRDCFFRASDDIFAIYDNWLGYDKLSVSGNDVSNITIEDSVLSTSISNVVRVSWPQKAFNSRNFVMRNCDVIHMGTGGCRVPFGLLEIWADPAGKGQHSGHLFEDIRMDYWYSLTQLRQPNPGIRDIQFRNIWALERPALAPSVLLGDVDGVTFDNVKIGDRVATRDQDIPVEVQSGAKAPKYARTSPAPHASFTFAPSAIRPGQAVAFDASASGFAGGDIASYEWLFGDGAAATGKRVKHVFADAGGTLWDGSGRFRVLLRVTGKNGKADWTSRPVVVVKSLRDSENMTRAAAGLGYKYFEGSWSGLPEFDALQPVATGTTARLDLSPRKREDNYALVFAGFIDVPVDGGYTFTVLSKDGAELRIGATAVATSPAPVPMVCGAPGNAVQAASGSIGLRAGKHRFRVAMTDTAGPDGFAVMWEGPGIPLEEIPARALVHGKR